MISVLGRRITHCILRTRCWRTSAGTRWTLVRLIWPLHLWKAFTSTDSTDWFASKVCLWNRSYFRNIHSALCIVTSFKVVCLISWNNCSCIYSWTIFFTRINFVIENTALFDTFPKPFKDRIPSIGACSIKWIYFDEGFDCPVLLNLRYDIPSIDLSKFLWNWHSKSEYQTCDSKNKYCASAGTGANSVSNCSSILFLLILVIFIYQQWLVWFIHLFTT